MSTTYTYAKATKKATQAPQTPTTTSGTQRPSDTPMIGDQITLATIQEMMMQMQQKMDRQHEETREDIKKADQRMEARMETIQTVLGKHEKEITELKEQTGRLEQRFDTSDNRAEYQQNVNREMLEAITHLELEKASCYLRFQNIPESREENLKETMAEIIALFRGKPIQEIKNEIYEAYRISTSYARRNHLPREVHVRFCRKDTRDEIYNYARDNNIIYKEREIVVLRQIPRRVREKRRAFHFLSTKLNKNKIPFRWLIPEGLLVTMLDKKIRINTVDEARHFIEQYLTTDEMRDYGEEMERGKHSQEELSSEDASQLYQSKDRTEYRRNEGERERVRTRAQTEARREGPKENAM